VYDPEKHRYVSQSNHLIEASYKLSLQEQRIILLVASMIKRTDEDFHAYKVSVKYLQDLLGIEYDAFYKVVKDLTKKLIGRVLVIRKSNSTLQTSWCSSAEYFDGEGFVEICFDPKLKPYLLQLQGFFTTFQLKFLIQLKSIYAIRIYQLLKQYEKTGQRSLDVAELREMLKIEPDKYKIYRDFRKRVLLPAKEEINKKTDIQIDFKERRLNRVPVSLDFKIKVNTIHKGKELVVYEDETTNPELYKKLIEYFLLTPEQAQGVIIQFEKDPERINSNLTYVENQYKKGEVKNIGAYTLKAIKENYSHQISLFDMEEEEKKAQAQKEEAQKRLREQLEVKYNSYIMAEFENIKNGYSIADWDQIEKATLDEVKSKGNNQKINDRLLSPIVRATIRDRFITEGKILSLEDWQKQNTSSTAQ